MKDSEELAARRKRETAGAKGQKRSLGEKTAAAHNAPRALQNQAGSYSRVRSPLNVVSIGGGTGLSTLLSGLKKYSRAGPSDDAREAPELDITAVVTVSDDGGSSGRLRRDFDILPPGDIRNCMTALSEDEDLMSHLFRYRFASGRGLKGHSFGNLFLTALHQITGDFAQAVKLSSEILAIRGRIFPATSANIVLEAELSDGSVVRGESKISKSLSPIERVRLLPGDSEPLPETLEAIYEADLITLGPGSLYTSVIPNLLVNGLAEAISKSQAMRVYFGNLMWQPGETIDFSASQHVAAIHAHAQRLLIDCVVLNTAPIPANLQKRYARAHVQPVENDFAQLAKMGVRVVTADLVGDTGTASKRIRHDPDALAAVVIDLASRSRAHQSKKYALGRRQAQLTRKQVQ